MKNKICRCHYCANCLVKNLFVHCAKGHWPGYISLFSIRNKIVLDCLDYDDMRDHPIAIKRKKRSARV
jgi:hypothetical protein